MFNETAYDLAIGAGCSPEGARIAAAIAQAESSGNVRAYNPETKARGGTPAGQGSYGLWQIYLKAHPEFAGQNLYDPATNAAAMYRVSRGCTSFTPWSTFTQNLYQRFLQAFGGSPATDSGTTTPTAPIDSTLDWPDLGGGSDVITEQMQTDFLSGLPGGGLTVLALLAAAYFILR